MYKFLQSLEALNRLWREGLDIAQHSPQPFHVRPKGHVLQHLVEEKVEMWGSPSAFWCYSDESYCGDIKRIAARTKHPRTLEVRVGEKIRIVAGVAAARG